MDVYLEPKHDVEPHETPVSSDCYGCIVNGRPGPNTCRSNGNTGPGDAGADCRAATGGANAQSAGDNAWMLVSAALVLLMTGPGLALFYGGLVRKKNILGTMMQSFAMMGLVTILWAICGYSLAFGHGNMFVGGFEHLFLRGVGLTPNPDYAATIPEQTYMIYQLMFAIITPALITGAFAERMKFSAMAVFLSRGRCWCIARWRTWCGAWADC